MDDKSYNIISLLRQKCSFYVLCIAVHIETIFTIS